MFYNKIYEYVYYSNNILCDAINITYSLLSILTINIFLCNNII